MTFMFTGPVSFPIEVTELLAEIVKLRNLLTLTRKDIMAELADLTAAVAANTSVGDSVVVLLNGLTARIQELVDSSTELAALKAGLQTEIDNINADTQKEADAVVANTPAA